MKLLPIWRTQAAPALVSWVQALRRDLGERDLRALARVDVLLRALAESAVRHRRDEYERWRAAWLAAGANVAPAPGMSALFEDFAGEVVSASKSERDVNIAVTELSVADMDGLLADAPGEGNQFLLVIHPGVPTFANLLAKALAYAIPVAHGPDGDELGTGVAGWAQALTVEAPAVRRYLELVAATLAGRPGSAPAYMPPQSIAGLTVALRDAMELFLVGRLVAHLFLAHDELAPRRAVPLGTAGHLSVLDFTVDQQRDAFVLGCALAVSTPTFTKRGPLGYWGIEALVATLDWLRTVTSLPALASAGFLGVALYDNNSAAACRDVLRRMGRSGELEFAAELEPALHALRHHLVEWLRQNRVEAERPQALSLRPGY